MPFKLCRAFKMNVICDWGDGQGSLSKKRMESQFWILLWKREMETGQSFVLSGVLQGASGHTGLAIVC